MGKLYAPNVTDSKSAAAHLSVLLAAKERWRFFLVENSFILSLTIFSDFYSISNSENPEDAPSSFCIARITVRGPCIVIKVAFLGGTEGNIRHKVNAQYFITIQYFVSLGR